MRIGLTLLLLCTLAGCVTEQVDESGKPIGKAALDKDLVMDKDGRIIGRPTRLVAPHTIIINGGTPTEREIRLLGVLGLPEREAPVTFKKAQEWMHKYLAQEEEIFIKPAMDSDLKARVIYGIVYLYARDERTGGVLDNAYVIVNQAMLSQGLVKIREAREIDDEWLRDRMITTEKEAKEKKLGLWSAKP
ncbi:MAG: thermonuclease family protein [Planctomycetes bacterium]|nr:thermonuclease family protein [Planctomycetota bacterium]MCW8135069.1 thermonuclease family protein [Planctomycetota bacterium]